MRPAPILLAALLTCGSLAALLSPPNAFGSSPLIGVLRGWENEENVPEIAYDIAVDKDTVSVVGTYYSSGIEPFLLILDRRLGTVNCQVLLKFKDAQASLDFKIEGLTTDTNERYVAVAGYYYYFTTDVKRPAMIARVFVALYEKETCKRIGVTELGNFSSPSFPSPPQSLKPGDIGVDVEITPDGEIYLLLSPYDKVEEDAGGNQLYPIYLIRLDESLNIIAAKSFALNNTLQHYATDLEIFGDRLYVAGDIHRDLWSIDIFLLVLNRDLEPINSTTLPNEPGTRLSWPSIAIDPEGYVYVAANILPGLIRLTPLPMLFKLDRDLNIIYAQFIWYETVHQADDYRFDSEPYVIDVAVSLNHVIMVGYLVKYDPWDPKAPRIYDGNVIVLDKSDGTSKYFLKIVSMENNAYDVARRVNSVAHGVDAYQDCAYLTGMAENYYLEYHLLNIDSYPWEGIVGQDIPIRETYPVLDNPRFFDSELSGSPIFDRDVAPTKFNGFIGALCVLPLTVSSTTTSTATTTQTATITRTTTERTTTTLRPATTLTSYYTSTVWTLRTSTTTELLSSTIYTTRLEIISQFATMTATITEILFATLTPTKYSTVETTLYRNQTILTIMTAESGGGQPSLPLFLLPFAPLLLIPPLIFTSGRSLTITILEGASRSSPHTTPTSILNEHFKPCVGRLKRKGTITFLNRDKTTHEIEIFNPDTQGSTRLTLQPNKKAKTKITGPGKYFFRLTANPQKIGIIEAE